MNLCGASHTMSKKNKKAEIIKNEQQVKQIMEHLKKNRDTKLVQEIKRYSNN